MRKEGLLLCVCQGTCPSFEKENIYEIANYIRKDIGMDFVAIHCQLCADDGDRFLQRLLKNSEDIGILYVAGCDPQMQVKMFKDSFEKAGYDISKLVGIDIRNKTTEESKKLIADAIQKTRAA